MASVSVTSVERPYMRDIVTQLKECLAAELARKHDNFELQNEDLVGKLCVNLMSTDMTLSARMDMHAMAKMIVNTLLLLLGALSFVARIQGQDQSAGFISIDCGLPENSSYTEKNTGINYISDDSFIDSGVPKIVSAQDKATHQ
ncbi:hypothetical protein PIB30_040819 [Stylosanthes scabra]|uniref:Malectin-like domain-containing protein n=1 Tax=Stylosanthes scabra TaxID=79078 RepID=A0ABU6UFZ9_9FABA|nr:hypothetical protein [Stylosanthes scabra]